MGSVTWVVIQGRKERLFSRVIVTDELEHLELPSTVDVTRERVELLQRLGLTVDDINEFRKNTTPVLGYLEKIGIQRPKLGELIGNYCWSSVCLLFALFSTLPPLFGLLNSTVIDYGAIGNGIADDSQIAPWSAQLKNVQSAGYLEGQEIFVGGYLGIGMELRRQLYVLGRAQTSFHGHTQ